MEFLLFYRNIVLLTNFFPMCQSANVFYQPNQSTDVYEPTWVTKFHSDISMVSEVKNSVTTEDHKFLVEKCIIFIECTEKNKL